MVYTISGKYPQRDRGSSFLNFVPFWFLKTRHGGWNSDLGSMKPDQDIRNADCLQTAGGGAGVHLWTHFSHLFKSFCVTIIMQPSHNPLMAFLAHILYCYSSMIFL